MKKQITKSYLAYLGVTDVTTDGRVFTKRGERKPKVRNKAGRLSIALHDEEIRKSIPKDKRNDNSGYVDIQLHHVVYAWFNNEVPYGKEIHHKDLNYLNNSISNLEALTPAEHRALHAAVRTFESTRELKCRLDIPRKWYEDKLAEYKELYEEAKKNKDADKAHQFRSNVSHTRAKLRYYDNHIEEAQKVIEFKKDCMELAAWKKVFKENNKKLWKECCIIEKMVKEKGIEARPIVQHALEVIHKTFGRD